MSSVSSFQAFRSLFFVLAATLLAVTVLAPLAARGAKQPVRQGSAVEFDLTKTWDLQWWLQHLSDAYEANPVRSVVEFVAICSVFWLLLRAPSPRPDAKKLTEREKEQMIREWEPESLVPADLNVWARRDRRPVVSGPTGPMTRVGKRTMLNFASHNYLGLANHPELKRVAKETIQKFAVGSCGPRGFYGTMEAHLALETRLRTWFGTEAAIIYADWIGCMPSVITAFAKKGDLIIVDEGVHCLIRQAIYLSRANVLTFKHNDMDDLSRALQSVQETDERQANTKLNRRFIVTEGVFHNSGDICPLREIMNLKRKFKYRLILDDTHGLGTLAPKGSPQYWKVGMDEIEMYAASMDASFGSTGGFCVGSQEVCYHQSLSGSGYVFSASAPPFQVQAVVSAISLIDAESERVRVLQRNAKVMRRLLSEIDGVAVDRESVSPLVVAQLEDMSKEAASAIIEQVASEARERGILVFPTAYLPSEYPKGADPTFRAAPTPGLRVCVTCEHKESQLEQAAAELRKVFSKLLRGDL